MQGSIFRPRADVVEVLDACYAPCVDDARWSSDVVGAMTRLLNVSDSVGLHAIEHSADCREFRTLFFVDPTALGPIADSMLVELGPDAIRSYYYSPPLVSLQSEIDRGVSGSIKRAVARSRGTYRDALGLIVHPEPNVALVLFAFLDTTTGLGRADRTRLGQLALHLEAAVRLRRRPEALRAVFDARGNVLEAGASEGSALAGLRPSVARVAAARSTQDLELWTPLVNGEVSILSRSQGSRRVYAVVDNAHRSRSVRAFTAREVEVLAMAARGISGKLCAYSLGVSPSAVSSALARVAAKVGVVSRVELLRVAALIARDPRVEVGTDNLSGAERDVLGLIVEGLSNHDIARRRGRSVRTIANQVAAILRKTGSSSRRDVATSAATVS